MSKDIMGVYIGRFQPFHNLHLKQVQRALDEVSFVDEEDGEFPDGRVLMVVSGAEKEDERHPFEYFDIRSSIINSLSNEELHRVIITQIFDNESDKEWQYELIQIANRFAKGDDIMLFGDNSEPSGDYLNCFPGWYDSFERCSDFHASDVRKVYFNASVITPGWQNKMLQSNIKEPDWKMLKAMVPEGTFTMLKERHRIEYNWWLNFTKDYK